VGSSLCTRPEKGSSDVQVPVYNLTGEVAGNIEINDDVFGVPMKGGLVHQALIRQLANRRQGTVSTKTRSTVSGSSKKLYAQKHTGRARRGDVTSPVLSGGGTAFGPHQRDYRQAMPKKMRRLALRCVLSSKASSGGLRIINDFDVANGKTRGMADVIAALGASGSVLIATGELDAGVIRVGRNLAGVNTTPAALLNVADILSHETLVMTVAAVRKAEELWSPKQGLAEVVATKDNENTSGTARS
jgi:large subunit ribosomal protein L4